ncbi:hypothetical protein FOZ62_010828 [Perkinsus olseni]|uniref:RRM domain-containing protein n=2 Tax=Perkinsus olseni TaxID=32597 RepID=A0A7J6SBJ9_PEROL|nr:hypothetical protein FOZ62_010828 [Perkinsus olseni]
MRCGRFGEVLNVEKVEDKMVVNFKNTKSAYSAREKLDNSKFDDNEVHVYFGPQQGDHHHKGKGLSGDGAAPAGGIAVRMDVDPLTGEYLAGARVVGTGARHANGGMRRRLSSDEKPALKIEPPEQPVSHWSEVHDLEHDDCAALLDDYSKHPHREYLNNRYVLFGNLPSSEIDIDSRRSIEGFLARWVKLDDLVDTNKIIVAGIPVLHVTLRSTRAAAFLQSHVEKDLHDHGHATHVAFAPPLKADKKLWVGWSLPMGFKVSETDLNKAFASFGYIEDFRMLENKNCAFIQYSHVADAVKAYNSMYGLEIAAGHFLNVDFTSAPAAHSHQSVGFGGNRENVPGLHQSLDEYRSHRLGGRDRSRSPHRHRHRSRSRDDRRSRRHHEDRESSRSLEDSRESTQHRSAETLYILKMGELACQVKWRFVRGSEANSLSHLSKLNIDQRTKIDHCRSHVERQPKETTIWYISAATKEDCEGYDKLCDYFIGKDRVGFIHTGDYYYYLCPPSKACAEALSLEPSCYMILVQIAATPGDAMVTAVTTSSNNAREQAKRV